MLFCISIIFKTKLPLFVVFNKSDAADAHKTVSWLLDYDKFLEELGKEGEKYVTSLSRSMALSLEEFYSDLAYVCVSSLTHKGFDNIIQKLDTLKDEYSKIKDPTPLQKEQGRDSDNERQNEHQKTTESQKLS